MKSTNPAFSSANADADLPANAAPRAIVPRPACVRVCTQRRSHQLPETTESAPRCGCVCSQMRLRLLPDAVASAPAFVNKHREQIGGDDSAAPICRHPKYGATLFPENKNPVNSQPFVQLRIYRICALRISLRCALRLISSVRYT